MDNLIILCNKVILNKIILNLIIIQFILHLHLILIHHPIIINKVIHLKMSINIHPNKLLTTHKIITKILINNNQTNNILLKIMELLKIKLIIHMLKLNNIIKQWINLIINNNNKILHIHNNNLLQYKEDKYHSLLWIKMLVNVLLHPNNNINNNNNILDNNQIISNIHRIINNNKDINHKIINIQGKFLIINKFQTINILIINKFQIINIQVNKFHLNNLLINKAKDNLIIQH